MRRAAHALIALIAAAASCGLLSGCMVGPDFHRPATPAVDHYASGGDPKDTAPAGGVSQHFRADAPLPFDWWRAFGSPQINAVVADAIGRNPGVAVAQANLRQSQHLLQAGYGVFFPAVGAEFDTTRQRYSPTRLGFSQTGRIFNLFTLSASISYMLDIWGGERRQVEGLKAQARESQAVEQGTYLTLAANIVNTMVARAAYLTEIDDTRALVALEREQLAIVHARVLAGYAAYSAELALRSQLAGVEATLPPLQQKADQAGDLLATLTGRAPAEWTPPDLRLADIALPSDLPLALPSELVRKRPDIQAAEAEVHAASAGIGVATAAMLPSISLTASYGGNANSVARLFSSGNALWSVGGQLATPAIQGGALWSRRKAAIDQYDAAVAGFRQTVLAAFAQVADTLRALEHDASAVIAEDEALAAARDALALLGTNRAAGLVDDTDVLVADMQYHQAEIASVQARAVRYQDTVALYAAIGGGWWPAADAPSQGQGQGQRERN